jgi:subtilisin family serine protease
MSPELNTAWSLGYQGQGTTITTVDDFSSTRYLTGNLGTGSASRRHGEWVQDMGRMVAPAAFVASHGFASGSAVSLAAGLNVMNLSYSMYATAGYSVSMISWSATESSLIKYAREGRAVIVKAAGNDGVGIGATNSAGKADYLNMALIGTPSAIFVGALDRNGSPTNLANLTSYSNRAGTNTTAQNQFLSVGVLSGVTGLAGTSFAAPIVSGYAAIIGSKFTAATPSQITNQLLNTARQDTIRNYNPALHGRGEASIARALAPQAIQ